MPHSLQNPMVFHTLNPEAPQNDEYSVLFIAHKDDAPGKARTRRLFCDINKNAVAVAEGDKVVIDEDDLCAIVARRIYAEFVPLGCGSDIAVTEKKEQVSKDGKECFTSLLAVYSVCKRLKKLFKKPRGTLDNAPENIQTFQAFVTSFFDFVIKHEPSFKRYFSLKSTSVAKERVNNKNLFFRPIGLELLARLYTHFYTGQKLPKLATALKSISTTNPGGVFDGLLWNSGKIEATSKAKNAAFRLCLYLLDETTKKENVALLALLKELMKDPQFELPQKL